MGIPYVDAPTEAEARKSALFVCDYHILFHLECAALVKEGKVYGIGTEDMDVNKT
jgi:5'-3' exonuclease